MQGWRLQPLIHYHNIHRMYPDSHQKTLVVVSNLQNSKKFHDNMLWDYGQHEMAYSEEHRVRNLSQSSFMYFHVYSWAPIRIIPPIIGSEDSFIVPFFEYLTLKCVLTIENGHQCLSKNSFDNVLALPLYTSSFNTAINQSKANSI